MVAQLIGELGFRGKLKLKLNWAKPASPDNHRSHSVHLTHLQSSV